MKLQPLNNTVYIIEETETVTQHGIVLPGEQKKSGIGRIYAIGANDYDLQVGDKVLFSKFQHEDVDWKDDNGPVKHLISCPFDSLTAQILD